MCPNLSLMNLVISVLLSCVSLTVRKSVMDVFFMLLVLYQLDVCLNFSSIDLLKVSFMNLLMSLIFTLGGCVSGLPCASFAALSANSLHLICECPGVQIIENLGWCFIKRS